MLYIRFFKIITLLALALNAFSAALMAQQITCKVARGYLIINPEGMQLSFIPKNSTNNRTIGIVESNVIFSSPYSVVTQNNGQVYEIKYETCKVVIDISDNCINFKIYPQDNMLIKWPRVAEPAELKSYLLPHGEGLFIPSQDARIRGVIDGMEFNHENKMPFIGIMYDDFVLTIVEHMSNYRTQVVMTELGKGINYEYDFRQRDNQPVYELSFVFSNPELLAPAKVFRSFLKKNNNFVSLEEKIKQNPNISDLAGAIHIYMWGNGRTIDAINALKEAGITKAWIGYAEKAPNNSEDDIQPVEYYVPKMHYVNSEYIQYAKNQGYIVGVYDSYHTVTPTKLADCYNVDFGISAYPKYCIRDKNGNIMPGFRGRGCYVSMTAFKKNNNDAIMHQRINKFKADGVNSYFLDCHGTGEVFDDYSIDHPQTIFDDISIRLQHLKFLSKQNLVLGTESVVADAAPFASFAHGNFSTLYNIHYKLTRNVKKYGPWYPPARPNFFFKSIIADDNYALRYDPQYRIPLFQAVLHDSIIVTDRWEIPLTKFINLYKDRFLLEFLYGVPSMWSLDIKAIKQYRNVLKQLGKEFLDLHSQIMAEELTDFQYLTGDRKIQQAVFGNNKVIIIANFRDVNYQDIPKKALKVIYNSSEVRIIEPEVPSSFIRK